MGDHEKNIENDETGHPVTRADLQIAREKIAIERERMALEREKLAAERERWKAEERWHMASASTVKINLGTVFLISACCLLFGCLLGGIWMVAKQDRLEAVRQQAAAQRRQELVEALTGETNLTSRASTLLQTIGGTRGGAGGILLILD